MIMIGASAFAQTPVEDLIAKYRKYSGASCMSVSGFELTLARPALMASPLAPVASDVHKLTVLHMGGVSDSVKDIFDKNLYGTLGSYDAFGVHSSPNGDVEVYARFSDTDRVSELVIFNPTLCVLNDIQGDFNVAALKKIK